MRGAETWNDEPHSGKLLGCSSEKKDHILKSYGKKNKMKDMYFHVFLFLNYLRKKSTDISQTLSFYSQGVAILRFILLLNF
jgi:hypothetical protein